MTEKGETCRRDDGKRLAAWWRKDWLNTLFAAVATLLSVLALGHSFWTDGKSRHCNYQHNKHIRLATMVDELRDISSEYDKLFLETKITLLQREILEVEADRQVKLLVSKRLSSVNLVERVFGRNRDIVDPEVLVRTDSAIEELTQYVKTVDTGRLKAEDMAQLHALSDSIVTHAIEDSRKLLLNAGEGLREHCSS
ncbi:MAG: hypothetical protein OXU42_03935 [Deltaproteobacteria bacterium]|nr:hypothetical protein [Deltaproteobacteria bacterium]